MDTTLKELLNQIKVELKSGGKEAIKNLAIYFLQKRDWQTIIASMSELSAVDLLSYGVGLGEAWNAANEASAAQSQKLEDLGWAILFHLIDKGFAAI